MTLLPITESRGGGRSRFLRNKYQFKILLFTLTINFIPVQGGGNSIVFHLHFLTHSPASVTSHSNGQEPRVACAN